MNEKQIRKFFETIPFSRLWCNVCEEWDYRCGCTPNVREHYREEIIKKFMGEVKDDENASNDLVDLKTRCWKPLGVGGLRLYKVSAYYPPTRERVKSFTNEYIVAAKSPTHAANLVSECYKDCEPKPIIDGHALTVLQPKEWWENGVPYEHDENDR